MIYRIRSRSNQRVKDLIKKKDQYFFFEGEKLVNDILKRGIEISLLIVNEKKENQLKILKETVVEETWYVSRTVLEKISSLKEKPDFIAVLEWREAPIDFHRASVVIGLDSIQDPANVGTVFRCAAAFGIDAVALAGNSVNLNNSKFLRAAQDSFFKVNYQRFADVETLIREAEAANFNIYLTSSHDSSYVIAPYQIERPCLILFGNEGKGLEEALFDRYPSVKIPQEDKIESLNVGVSACIIMYEVSLAFGIVR
ncbi:MAG: RNA methyltransferase [Candidatus Aminicenantes bacterium]|nr:MAG: RNA methyltransferase [Candidatus Aminicenantes bacterium]